MKNWILFLLIIFSSGITLAQTASDYYMPLCVGNTNVLHTTDGPIDWAARTVTFSFIKTDLIDGETYYVEEGSEYLFEPGTSGSFRFFWLKKNNNGEIMLRAFSDQSSVLTSATILPADAVLFPNNYLTKGYSFTSIYGINQTISDSVISVNASNSGYSNCLQIREINRTNGVITVAEDRYYAPGIGIVGAYRFSPASQDHIEWLESTFVTACEPITDTISSTVVNACLGPSFDYWVNDIQVNTVQQTVTVNWVFQEYSVTKQFSQIYNYQYLGNNVISLTMQCSGKSASQTFYKTINISSTQTGIDESVLVKAAVTIYPNPAKDNITVSKTDKRKAVISLYNQAGALVKTEKLNKDQQSFTIAHLSNGIYLAVISSEAGTEQLKLVIQR